MRKHPSCVERECVIERQQSGKSKLPSWKTENICIYRSTAENIDYWFVSIYCCCFFSLSLFLCLFCVFSCNFAAFCVFLAVSPDSMWKILLLGKRTYKLFTQCPCPCAWAHIKKNWLITVEGRRSNCEYDANLIWHENREKKGTNKKKKFFEIHRFELNATGRVIVEWIYANNCSQSFILCLWFSFTGQCFRR